MAAKSKKNKVEPTEVETPSQAVPAEMGAFIAFVTAEVVPGLLDKKYPGAKKGSRRADAYKGKSVSRLKHDGLLAGGKKPLSQGCTSVASSTGIDAALCNMLLTRFDAEKVPSGYALSQGIVLGGRVVGVIPEDLEYLAHLIAAAREAGSTCVTEGIFKNHTARLLADAAAFREACERGDSEVIGF